MVRPYVMYVRKVGWAEYSPDDPDLDLIYVPIAGSNPRKRMGKLTGDAQYSSATPKGIVETIRVLKERRPQFLVWWHHTTIQRKEMYWMREVSPSTKWLVADGNQPAGLSKYMQRFRDLTDVALINSKDIRTYEQYVEAGLKVATLYDGFHPYDHPSSDIARIIPTHDCFFGGSNHLDGNGDWVFPGGQFRYQLIEALDREFGFLLHGPPDSWKPIICRGSLTWPAYYQAFKTARITIGCNHYDLDRYYTRRTIHAGTCGRLLITKYVPGMEADFDNHRDLVWFKTIDEAVDLVRHYLLRGEEREKITRRQRIKFLARHSWKARLDDLKRIVRELT